MALTLAPLLNPLSDKEYESFYAAMAERPEFRRVCIGETVCLKRRRVYDAVIRRLKDAGKEVVFCTPYVIAPGDEITVPDGVDALEIHDFAALESAAGLPVVAGEQMRIYNQQALDFIVEKGFAGAVLPQDLPVESAKKMQADIPLEIIISGRKLLGISGRCHHARHYGRSRDDCGQACMRDRNGLRVDTLDGKPLMLVNGLQTLGFDTVETERLPGFAYRVDLSFSSDA